MEDPSVRYALEKAFWKLDRSLEHITKLTYAGLEDGRPILEVRSTRTIPSELQVGGDYGVVAVRATEDPVGVVLYEAAE